MSDNNDNNNENKNDDDHNDDNNNNNSDKRMSDAESKAAARGHTPAASKPGVVSVSGEQAARLDQRIAEKRSGAVPSGSSGGSSKQLSAAPAELNRLEQDLEAKQRGRSGAGATGPGATPAAPAVPSKPGAFSSARSELTNLESDVAAKNRAARPPASTPGAVAESLDQKVAAKVRGEAGTTTKPGASSAATAELNNLENAVQAKMRTNGVAPAVSSSVPGARASLSRLEDAVTAKAGTTVGRATAEISRLDDRIAAKNASAAAPPTSTPRSLQDAEDAVLKKKGNNDNNNVNQKHSSIGNSDIDNNINDMPNKRDELDMPEQYPVSTANKDETGGLYDSGDEGLDSDLLASGGAGGGGAGAAGSGLNPQNDLEYGVYGGPDEKGLAVAVAVEEEDDDMFIPAAVEYDPDAKPPMYRNRRFRLYAFLAMVIVVVVTIGAAVGITLGKTEKIPDISYRETIGIRENIERLVGTDVLDDPKSPYRKALDWITHEDAMMVTPEDKTFTQRYYAAYFYFATTTKRPWDGGCNPPAVGTNETEMCTYLRMVGVDPAEYSDIPWTRWLTNTPECGWAGISCDELGQFRSMEFCKFEE